MIRHDILHGSKEHEMYIQLAEEITGDVNRLLKHLYVNKRLSQEVSIKITIPEQGDTVFSATIEPRKKLNKPKV